MNPKMERTIERAVAWLKFQPHGSDPDGVAAALDLTEGHLRRALALAEEAGLLWSKATPTRDSKTRRTYYAIKFGPSGKGQRFSVEEPEPHFSSLGIGRYDDADTWAARATKGRECSTS